MVVELRLRLLCSSVDAVLGGGGGVCGGGVVRQGPAARRPPATAQQSVHLPRHAAGEGRVDPRVGAGVQAGQQHQDGERHPWRSENTHTHTHTDTQTHRSSHKEDKQQEMCKLTQT